MLCDVSFPETAKLRYKVVIRITQTEMVNLLEETLRNLNILQLRKLKNEKVEELEGHKTVLKLQTAFSKLPS